MKLGPANNGTVYSVFLACKIKISQPGSCDIGFLCLRRLLGTGGIKQSGCPRASLCLCFVISRECMEVFFIEPHQNYLSSSV